MDQTLQLTGEHALSCASFVVHAEVVASDNVQLPIKSRIDLTANGPDDNGSIRLAADGNVSCRVADACVDVVAGGVVLEGGADGRVGLRAGNALTLQAVDLEGDGGNIVLKNGQLPVSPTIQITPDGIEMSVGPNKITIGPTGIVIQGLEVSITGEMSASMSGLTVSVEGQTEASLKGLAGTTVESSAMTTVKGAMVMIN